MITQEQAGMLVGRAVHDRDGDKIGTVGQVWADAAGMPTWVSVKTGFFGMKESLAPLQDADLQEDRLTMPYDKAKVKDAPNIDISHDEPLTQDEVDRLYEYYELRWDDSYHAYQAGASASRDADFVDSARGGAATDESIRGEGVAGDRTSSTSSATDRDAMTRSEERLKVSTEREQVARARLRKYVVTEQQQVTVPVQHEEVRLEREPITDATAGDAYEGSELSEDEHEVTLHAERARVETETVPVERVRLSKESVRDEQTVGGDVRKERIETDLPQEGRRDR